MSTLALSVNQSHMYQHTSSECNPSFF